MSGKLIASAVIILFVSLHTESLPEDFFKEQTEMVKTFFKQQFYGVETIKDGVAGYIEEQKKKISGDVNNYLENIQDSGRNIVDRYMFMWRDDPKSRIENPELVLSVPSIIKSHGYDCETHTVLSEGFFLNVHRIPRPKNGSAISRNTVLLQHGFAISSAVWILNGPQKSLAYALADAEYDVWMTNTRGNKYSNENIHYKRNTKEYWNFSWHEVAVYDLPAIIDYIQKIKGEDSKIAFIGHSIGTTILFTMLSVRPEYNTKLSKGIALAPLIFISNMESPLKFVAPIATPVALTEMLYGSYEFIPKNSFLDRMNAMCGTQNMDTYVCKNVVFYLCGDDEKQFNKTLLPIFLSNFGTGTSWKLAIHMSQLVQSGEFQQFDYDFEDSNQRVYGTPTPPKYDLTKVTLNITLFWSRNDFLSNEKDVRKLHDILPSTTEMYLVPFDKFNHIDYVWAIEAPRLVNSKVLEILKSTFKP